MDQNNQRRSQEREGVAVVDRSLLLYGREKSGDWRNPGGYKSGGGGRGDQGGRGRRSIGIPVGQFDPWQAQGGGQGGEPDTCVDLLDLAMIRLRVGYVQGCCFFCVGLPW